MSDNCTAYNDPNTASKGTPYKEGVYYSGNRQSTTWAEKIKQEGSIGLAYDQGFLRDSPSIKIEVVGADGQGQDLKTLGSQAHLKV